MNASYDARLTEICSGATSLCHLLTRPHSAASQGQLISDIIARAWAVKTALGGLARSHGDFMSHIPAIAAAMSIARDAADAPFITTDRLRRWVTTATRAQNRPSSVQPLLSRHQRGD